MAICVRASLRKTGPYYQFIYFILNEDCVKGGRVKVVYAVLSLPAAASAFRLRNLTVTAAVGRRCYFIPVHAVSQFILIYRLIISSGSVKVS